MFNFSSSTNFSLLNTTHVQNIAQLILSEQQRTISIIYYTVKCLNIPLNN